MKIINKRSEIYKYNISELWAYMKKVFEPRFMLEKISFEKMFEMDSIATLFPNPPYLVNACIDKNDGYPIEQLYFQDFLENKTRKRTHYAIILVCSDKNDSNHLIFKTITYSVHATKFSLNDERMFQNVQDICDYLRINYKLQFSKKITMPSLESNDSDPEPVEEKHTEILTQYKRKFEDIKHTRNSDLSPPSSPNKKRVTSPYFPNAKKHYFPDVKKQENSRNKQNLIIIDDDEEEKEKENQDFFFELTTQPVEESQDV